MRNVADYLEGQIATINLVEEDESLKELEAGILESFKVELISMLSGEEAYEEEANE